mgnify:FL=1
MKALIVEDELLARLGMRSLIDWESMGITLLEDASNGADALKTIEKEQPELILLDLNIPEISGLELLQIIRQKGLPCKAIVVSCYEDFDTVKKAMMLGAVDYIRKFGLSKDELVASLRNVLQAPVEKPAYLQQSAVQTSMQMKKKLQQIPPAFMSGYLLSFYMLWKYSEEMTDMKIVESVACQYYQKLGRNLMTVFYEGKLLLLMKEETTQAEVDRLRKLIFQFVTNRCYIGITPYQLEQQDDQFFVQMANSIEVYGFYECSSQTVVLEAPIEIKKALSFDVDQCMEQLEYGIAKISEKEMNATLRYMFDQIEATPYISVNLVKKLMIEMLSRFSQKATALGGTIEEIEVQESRKHYQKIVNITSFKEVESWWMEFLPKFSRLFFTRQKKTESDIIQSALDYIEANLDKPIQLSDVAKMIGVSEPYLSSYFKSTMNENFIPYVNRMKMKRAKELLKDGKLVYQVSDILGYENATYFSMVFKRVEGMTPEQYRKNLYGGR